MDIHTLSPAFERVIPHLGEGKSGGRGEWEGCVDKLRKESLLLPDL